MRVPKEVSVPNFDYYYGASDLIQHVRHFQDKMVIYSCNDLILCITYPFSLKAAASDWFNSLSFHSLRNFEEVTKVFLTKYAPR